MVRSALRAAADRWGGWRGVVACVAVLSVLCILAGPGAAAAQSDPAQRPWYEKFVDDVGTRVFAFAWPTATYQGVEFGGVSFVPGGVDVTAILRGWNFFGLPLWTELVLEIRGREIQDLRFGRHNALQPPGATMSAVRQFLLELNKEYERRRRSASTSSLEWGPLTVPDLPAKITVAAGVAVMRLSSPTSA